MFRGFKLISVQVQGLFGNRPSHGLVSLDGVMPLAPELDTAGLLVRDPALWTAANQALYPGNLTLYNTMPHEIYTINWPTSASTPANAMLLNFLNRTAALIGANITAFNIQNAWTANTPAGAPASLTTLLNITYPVGLALSEAVTRRTDIFQILISKEQTALVRDPWYAAYAAANDGRLPFVDPQPLVRWAFGDSYPAQTLTDAVTNKTIFMDWWNNNILVANTSSDTCTNRFIFYVGSTASTNYRNRLVVFSR